MAVGDVVIFDQFHTDEGLQIHNLNVDTLKAGIVTNAVTPSASTPDPRWGPGGSTDFSAQEVTPGGTYLAGGADITNTFVKSNGHSTLAGQNVTWDKNAANPTSGWWAIIYNDTAAGKQCWGFVELGGPVDMTAGVLSINWNALGIGRKQSA